LPKEIVMAWRRHLGTSEGQYGVDWLRHNYRRNTEPATDALMIREAARWQGYMDALDDVQDLLTRLPQSPRSLEEPSIGAPQV
jgi:hypothetical protein